MCFFSSEIDNIRILINYDGYWKGNIYKDGYLEMVFVPRNLTYEILLVMVHEIVCSNLSKYVYELRSLLNINGKIIRFKIKNDRDLQYVLRERNEILELYMTIQHSE